ncbi:formylmethanofuran dehydrogenase subunit B [Thalassoroseus pseudoceratinae]|uniref:formylmethanofuran dehydrogenase subunit B n=1 Tax=Thalassoroseus pseudoceratinae TaxID=2713176 RepID=UPI001F0E2466|nr:formylmethanofuran dehydrogenase subunit B [Thalassoroseus pseudoceratinae]
MACTICGCVCDDLTITTDNGAVIQAERACTLAEPWFLEQSCRHSKTHQILEEPADYEDAIDRATQLLRKSTAPLIYGLSRSSTPGQRAATALADHLGAVIDTTASRCHAPSILAFQQAGEPTCSLGEIRNRADLVVYWGSNPLVSHPRHLERYSIEPVGRFVPNGRADRTLVVVDVEQTATTEVADVFVRVEPNRDYEALWTLRSFVAGHEPPENTILGSDREALRDLANRMKSCECGVIFFGLGLTQQPLGHLNVDALLRLAAELNQHSHFYARRMRVPGDVTGADSVLCWQTGYPFSVDLRRGYPRYNPGEFSANDLLEQNEVDLCLLVGSEGVPALSPLAQQRLQSIPTIVLDYPTVESTISPTVRFTTAVYGVHHPGTAYRMDEVPIPLRPFLTSELPTDHQVLNTIVDRIKI